MKHGGSRFLWYDCPCVSNDMVSQKVMIVIGYISLSHQKFSEFYVLLTVHSQPAHRTVTYWEYYTRCCINTIWPPDDEHRVARNMWRIIIINVLYNVIVHEVGHLPKVKNSVFLCRLCIMFQRTLVFFGCVFNWFWYYWNMMGWIA